MFSCLKRQGIGIFWVWDVLTKNTTVTTSQSNSSSKTVEKTQRCWVPQLKARRIVAQLAAVENGEGGYMVGRYKVGPEPLVTNGVITSINGQLGLFHPTCNAGYNSTFKW